MLSSKTQSHALYYSFKVLLLLTTVQINVVVFAEHHVQQMQGQ